MERTHATRVPTAPKGNARGSGYAPSPNEWYVEPPSAVVALFKVEKFTGAIHDPACGGGNIPNIARELGHRATGADIVDRGVGAPVQDFLTDARCYDNIVTNPPFSHAENFALRGLAALTNPSLGKVCILQRLSWMEGQGRYERLFSSRLLSRVWVFSSRISMPPGGSDIPATGGSIAYAWFVFQAGQGPTKLGWLP